MDPRPGTSILVAQVLPPEDDPEEQSSRDAGYCCRLCGVGFDISRIRRIDEPFEAAWCGNDRDNAWLGELCGSYVLAEGASFKACKSCKVVERIEPPHTANSQDEDENDGSDFACGSEVSSEPYEFETPEDSVAGEPVGDALESEEDKIYSNFIRSISQNHHGNTHQLVHDTRGCDTKQMLEHVASKDCECQAAYSGYHISAEEMSACTTAQFLVPGEHIRDNTINAHWGPEPDDEDFENDRFFLSGIIDVLPAIDGRHDPYVLPGRHGLHWIPAANFAGHVNEALYGAMPFHPYCLEVYKRASLSRGGQPEIGKLFEWYRLENFLTHFESFPRHPAVLRGRGYEWLHHRGDEWLAANPCLIPALSGLLRGSRPFPDSTTSDPKHGASPSSSEDVFALPAEILIEILSYLDGDDLVHLVQSSRNFHRVPGSFYRRALHEQMPWLWELWCDIPLSHWATTTFAEEAVIFRDQKVRQRDLEDWRVPVLWDEQQFYDSDFAELCQALRDREKLQKQRSIKARLVRRDTPLWDADIDWRCLFIRCVRHSRKLKGLRNRERIWKDCNYILDRIDIHTRAGRMGEGLAVDPEASARDYFALNPGHSRPIRPH